MKSILDLGLSRLLALAPVIVLLLATGCVREHLNTENRTDQMRRLAVCMAEEAHKRDPDFIMVVQNAPALANEIEGGERNGILSDFQAAMDAYTAEALFFGDGPSTNTVKLAQLEDLPDHATVLVMDAMEDDNLQPSIDAAKPYHFIASPRSPSNYHYTQIPSVTPDSNSAEITRISDAKNFLYLINSDSFPSTDSMLDAIAATSFDLVFLDLFNKEGEMFSPAQLDRIRTKAIGGQRLILSYINVGAIEEWRPYFKEDSTEILKRLVACPYEGFDEEYWARYWAPEWHEIMYKDDDSYLQQIIDAGFDGIVMDNMEAYLDPCQNR